MGLSGVAKKYHALSVSTQISPLNTLEYLLMNNLVDGGVNLSALYKYLFKENMEFRAALSYSPNVGDKESEFLRSPRVFQLGINVYF